MGLYSQVFAPVMSVPLGARCGECFAMVQEADKWAHDGWHATLTPVPREPNTPETVESDEEMLRRLLREVVVLSQRMDGGDD